MGMGEGPPGHSMGIGAHQDTEWVLGPPGHSMGKEAPQDTAWVLQEGVKNLEGLTGRVTWQGIMGEVTSTREHRK